VPRAETLRRAIAAGQRIHREDAVWLATEAPDSLLRELSSSVRARFHAPDQATWMKMAIVNYTNICVARCDYCAFYRMPGQEGTYLLDFSEVCDRIDGTRSLGTTMVGFNGGFHPDLRISDYCELFRGVRERYPDMAFYDMTVAEFIFVARRSKLSYAQAAAQMLASGTRWITGGGAEILDDAFRLRHSPGKYKVEEYLEAQRAVLDAGLGSTATMVIGFDESLDERLNHLERLRRFQDDEEGRLASFLCWTYMPDHTELGGNPVPVEEYLRWLAICRIYLDNFVHIRTSVLTRNEDALRGLAYGANDFDLPTEDEVTEKAGAVIYHRFDQILRAARELGFEPVHRGPLPLPGTDGFPFPQATPAPEVLDSPSGEGLGIKGRFGASAGESSAPSR
jgi:cyclic dehypoxanthinyl futalosine synthase